MSTSELFYYIPGALGHCPDNVRESSMRSRKVEIRISAELLDKFDMTAHESMETRSAYIRQSIVLRLDGKYIAQLPDVESELDDMIAKFLPEDHPARQNSTNV